jgi:hypothetical protein
VEAAAAALAGPGRTRFPYWVLTLGALLAAVAVLAMAPTEREFRWMLGILFGFPAIVVGLAGIAVASSWRRRVASGPLGTIALLVPATILLALAWAAAGSRMPPLDRLARVVADTGPVARSIAVAATLLALGLVSSILNNARTRDRLETLRLRKAGGRRPPVLRGRARASRAGAARRVVPVRAGVRPGRVLAAVVRALRDAARRVLGPHRRVRVHAHLRVVVLVRVRLRDTRDLDRWRRCLRRRRRHLPRGRPPRARSRPASRCR